jgi:hypothetical protein
MAAIEAECFVKIVVSQSMAHRHPDQREHQIAKGCQVDSFCMASDRVHKRIESRKGFR